MEKIDRIEELPEILQHVVLTYSPVIDRSRRAIGTRLMAISTTGIDHLVSDVVLALSGILPGQAKFSMIAPFGLKYDASLLCIEAPSNVMVEIPAIALQDPAFLSMMPELARRGMRMALRGRSDAPIDQSLLPLFEYALVCVKDDRRKCPPPPGVKRVLRFIMTGAESVAGVDESFFRGAAATAGWPLNEAIVPQGPSGLQSSRATVMRMMALVNQYADVSKIEQAMKQDPAIAFKLLKMINSPGFGLPTKINSFSSAIMMLGYNKMLRWLNLLLCTSSVERNSLPLVHASVRRGLFMEQLGRGNAQKRDALFMVGVFSLIDKIIGQPIVDIFNSISVSKDIQNAVIDRTGPLGDELALIEAIEIGSASKIVSLQNKMGLTVLACNQALLHALRSAESLDLGAP